MSSSNCAGQTPVTCTQARPGVRLSVIGHTLDGRDMDLLQVGRKAWEIGI